MAKNTKVNNKTIKEFKNWFSEVIYFSIDDLKKTVVLKKTDNDDGFTEEVNLHQLLRYRSSKDKVFPLDTVEINDFERTNDTKLELPYIHYGPYANDLTRMMKAVAITIGKDIYFRNGAYKPETEEGKATIQHELTHIKQYSENKINSMSNKKDLEQEAIENEKNAYYDADPIITVYVKGIPFNIRKSQEKELYHNIQEEFENKLESYCNSQDNSKALELLLKYNECLENGDFKKWLI